MLCSLLPTWPGAQNTKFGDEDAQTSCSDQEDQADKMATALQLPATCTQPFSVTSDQTMIGQRWLKWVKGLEYFLTALNITNKKQKCAVLLHLAGAEVQTVFETLIDTGED